MNPRVESSRRATQSVERERADHIGGIGQRLRRIEFQTADRKHAWVPLMRLMPSLGCRSMASMPARRKASAPGRIGPARSAPPSANSAIASPIQKPAPCGPGRQIAARRRRLPCEGTTGVTLRLEADRERRSATKRADAGKSPLPGVGRGSASWRATAWRESGSPTPTAVRADHVALELIEIFARNAHVGKQADARIDGVDGVVAGSQTVDERAGLVPFGPRAAKEMVTVGQARRPVLQLRRW